MTKKLCTGKVVSDKMDKTVVVAVTRLVQHPQYKKIVKRVTRFKVHDEKKCQVGDIVNIIKTRPLSKDKRWMVVDIVEKAARGY